MHVLTFMCHGSSAFARAFSVSAVRTEDYRWVAWCGKWIYVRSFRFVGLKVVPQFSHINRRDYLFLQRRIFSINPAFFCPITYYSRSIFSVTIDLSQHRSPFFRSVLKILHLQTYRFYSLPLIVFLLLFRAWLYRLCELDFPFTVLVYSILLVLFFLFQDCSYTFSSLGFVRTVLVFSTLVALFWLFQLPSHCSPYGGRRLIERTRLRRWWTGSS